MRKQQKYRVKNETTQTKHKYLSYTTKEKRQDWEKIDNIIAFLEEIEGTVNSPRLQEVYTDCKELKESLSPHRKNKS